MKKETHNEYQKSLNSVIDYINDHLDQHIDLKVLAEIANISEFHFHRIFKALIGESVGSYTNRIRLETAAGLLRGTALSLLIIAEKTGYSNQQSLSKAFKKHFGITPSAFRNIESFFTSKFNVNKIKSLEIQPEVRHVKSSHLTYLRVIADYNDQEESYKAWFKLWDYAMNHQLINGENELIGFNLDDPTITKKDRCRYYACISTEHAVKPFGEFGYLLLEEGKYAVFTIKGAYSQLDELYDFIYQSWVFESDYILRDSWPFEKYLNTIEEVEEKDLLTEIYIPIL
ncbi:AraC family transcriptional regulator [Flammeovirga sp. SubArs3]|uniref:AraC family transcriptional regulator n=1 Tax=Flammeovirga sp. SubArs3 TaxID=2995316 RepID=UPI00248B3A0B|nr:AraC family transcriptional regulator [Flammeovirga sp. SubArs3]